MKPSATTDRAFELVSLGEQTLAGRLSNFEIYGDDPEALAAFYRELLGWRVERAEGVDYWRIAIDADAAPLASGGIARRPPFAQAGWMNFVEVQLLDATL
jgi:uncharacterized protein